MFGFRVGFSGMIKIIVTVITESIMGLPLKCGVITFSTLDVLWPQETSFELKCHNLSTGLNYSGVRTFRLKCATGVKIREIGK